MATTEQALQMVPPMFYIARLTDDQLERLADHAAYCMSHPPVSRRLAMYLSRVVQLEAERRQHEERGDEVLEVSMSSICAEHWSNAELVAALVKCSALREAIDGELYELVSKIYMVLFVEATERLDPRDEAGIGRRGRN